MLVITEAPMARLSSLLLVVTLLTASAYAKDKKKPSLPDYVLRATTVLVIIHPDAGEPVDEPTANVTARNSVEEALRDWGRLKPVVEGQEPDLVITVKTGNGRWVQRSIKGSPMDNRIGIGTSPNGGNRAGTPPGQPPSPTDDPNMGPSQTGPHTVNQVGANEDTFEVYRGGTPRPLESSPVWRYTARNCLREPDVSAVDEFRKAIADAEKQQASKKP